MPILFAKLLQTMVGIIFKSAYKDIKKNGLYVGANRKRVLRDVFPSEQEREMQKRIKRSVTKIHLNKKN